MTNIIVDGFNHYGQYVSGSPDTAPMVAVQNAMLSEGWAEFSGIGSLGFGLGPLPWGTDPNDLYISTVQGFNTGYDWTGHRRVLPAEQTTFRVSFYFGVDTLPNAGYPTLISLRNATNVTRVNLTLETTGALSIKNAANAILAITSGPVITPQNAAHIEMEVTVAGAVKVYVNGQLVINATGLTFSNAGNFAQFSVMIPTSTRMSQRMFMSHLIVRDGVGTFPVGDRKVATLYPNADAPAQGWTGRPLKRFGAGVLDLANAPNPFVQGPISTQTDIGANDFTIEGQFRFDALPTASNKAVLFGKWDTSAGDYRSYQLYLGGPTLDSGTLTFRTSTDGKNGTVVNKVQVPWFPVIGHWYHVAMCRSAGVLKLFIDGVQQGLNVADTDTYFAGARAPTLGAQSFNDTYEPITRFAGYQDEFRFTVGMSRYTANFAPPVAAFPRGVADPNWGAVKWLSSWDNGIVADDGPLGLSLVARQLAKAITPDDGAFNYQTINQHQPFDDTFIEAALLPATSLFTATANPTNGETVRVGTKDGTNAAVYTFKTALASAYDVLIGVTQLASLQNLVAAIIKGVGEGTTYGTGTLANADVIAAMQPSGQMLATAVTPGAVGNNIDTTDTLANGSWTGAKMAGGQDIPGYSEFRFSRMPGGTTVVDSITFMSRMWKSDVGSSSVMVSFVGGSGGKIDGAAAHVLDFGAIGYFDTFTTDPDTAAPLTPTTILNGKVRVNRTI